MNIGPLDHRSPSSQVDHLFVLTTPGQTRNALSIIAQFEGDPAVAAVVLGTAANPQLSDRILEALRRAGVDGSLVELPVGPTVPIPARVREIDSIYRSLVDSVPTRRLWIANTNSHYGLLARRFSEGGALVCYFEEGLGSYKAAADASYAGASPQVRRKELVAGLQQALEQHLGFSFVYRVPVAIRRFGGGVARFVVSARREVSVYRASSQRNRDALTNGGTGLLTSFFEPWTEFDQIRVAFPELLDRTVFRSTDVAAVHLSPTDSDVDAARSELDRLSSVPEALFISQPYLDRGRSYYGMVADAVAVAGVRSLLVKFHPREGPGARQTLLLAFERSGVEAVPLWRDDGVSAEALLGAGSFTTCVGVSSTSLLYAHDLYPDIAIVSVGRDVVRRVEKVRTRLVGVDRFVADVELYERSVEVLNCS